jgi:hypothetical protein
MTREYKGKLNKAGRKAFRSQMWAFRRDPERLTAEEQQALEDLFESRRSRPNAGLHCLCRLSLAHQAA